MLSVTPPCFQSLPQPPHSPLQRLYPIIPLSPKHAHNHQPEVMRLVVHVAHSWEVMWNRNALNSRSGIHREGWVCKCVRVWELESKDEALRGPAPPRTPNHLRWVSEGVWGIQNIWRPKVLGIIIMVIYSEWGSWEPWGLRRVKEQGGTFQTFK